MTSSEKPTKDTKTRLHTIVAHLLGAPGYIAWITGWLFLIVMILTAVGTQSGVIPVSTGSSSLDFVINPDPLSAIQGVITIIIVFAIWYVVASVIRKGVWWLCKRWTTPTTVWLVIMLGGLIVSWLGVGALMVFTNIPLTDTLAMVGFPVFAAIVSLSLEGLLVSHWKLPY